MTSVIVWDDHVSLQDWLIGYQVSGFDGQWKLDTWRFLSAEKAENREGWQLQGNGEEAWPLEIFWNWKRERDKERENFFWGEFREILEEQAGYWRTRERKTGGLEEEGREFEGEFLA